MPRKPANPAPEPAATETPRPSQALYRRWRPQQWDQVIGQDHVVQTLRNAVAAGRIGHAFLFAGPRGTGKTTTARLLAKAVNCSASDPASRPCGECMPCKEFAAGRLLDLIEIDAASNTSVDDVRDLREKINFSPSQVQFKVYIIDEVHMLSTAAFNALLKTLEEPPPHAKFILATTEVHKIPATVLSRCQRFEFRRVPVEQIAGMLRDRCAADGIEVDEDALRLICRQAGGSMRDAISLLDQLSSTGERVTLAEAQNVLGTAASEEVVNLVDAILAENVAEGLKILHKTLESGADPRQFARQVVEYLRGLLLVHTKNEALLDVTPEARQRMSEQERGFTYPRLLEAIRLFSSAASDTRGAWQPALGLELALAQAAASPAAAQPAATPEPVTAAAPARRTPPAPAQEESPRVQQQRADPPSSPAAPAQSAGGEAGESAMEQIRARWREIRAEVRKSNPLTEAALNSSRSQSMSGGFLVLSYPNELLMKKMATDENMALLLNAIRTVTGLEVRARCVVAGSRSAAVKDEAGGSIVRTALDLGGKIVYKE